MTAKDDKKSGTKDPWTSNLGKIGLQRYTVEEIAARDVHLKIQAVHDLNIEEEHPDVVDFAGSVLELGAGPGLPGLAAAQICRKAEKVVMSDNKDLVLRLLRKNIDKNFPKERARFQCAHLQWGDDVTSFRAKHGRFDVILGADLAYFRPDIPLLIETAKELLTEKKHHKMNGNMSNFTGVNWTEHETFWPCTRWHLENDIDYDLAIAACSHLPTPFLEENRKVGIAAAVVGTISLLTNGLVLSCILKSQHLTGIMYLFMANLAAADCVAGLFSFFICGVLQWELPPYLTLVGVFCLFFFVLVLSAVGVVLLSIDRYLAILHPIFYQTRMSGRHVAVSLGIAWPACALVCLSPLMGWNCFNVTSENCTKYLPVAYLILLNTVLFVAVVLVVFVNARILITLKRRLSRTRPMEDPRDDVPAARRREQRVATRQHRQLNSSLKKSLTVVMIAVAFIITWLPICIEYGQSVSRTYRQTDNNGQFEKRA
uniref:G-protein coupled receptors family 1 profile domain-containing protein n=1 Tax=Branchiostoma floridae TaxID=7739 RepID=C3YFE3_BRAFL|eukprot:XP_002604896.1 hypothetical protein BRAFLDRAFT_121640 [Branchiostoma floridae]